MYLKRSQNIEKVSYKCCSLGMFDQDQSGSIQLPEFRALWAYIQQWRGIFDHFDADRSGGISASELTVGQ